MGEDAEDALPKPVRWLLRLAWLSVFVVAGYLAWDIRMCTCSHPVHPFNELRCQLHGNPANLARS